MFRLIVAMVPVLTVMTVGSLQAQPELIRVWNLSWVDVSDSRGGHSTVPVLRWTGAQPPTEHVRYTAPAELGIVASLDENLRMARLSNDTEALAHLLSEEFVETDQNGNSRGKAEVIDRVRTFRISSVETSRAVIRFSDQAVSLVGEQIEVNPSGTIGNRPDALHTGLRANARKRMEIAGEHAVSKTLKRHCRICDREEPNKP